MSDRSEPTAGMSTLLRLPRQSRVALMGIRISTPPVPQYDWVRCMVTGNVAGGKTLRLHRFLDMTR